MKVPHVLAAAMLVAAVAGTTAAAAPGSGADPDYRYEHTLSAVDYVSPTDAWAVGRVGGCCTGTPLARHFDGARWHDMSLPPASEDDRLYDVAARTADDVWAVGESVTSSGGRERTLVEHWDGDAWSVVPSPTFDPASALHGVTAIGPDDVWAVGTYWTGTWTALLEHWDGRTWTVVDGPDVGDDVELASVSAVGSNDVWAVGNACDKAIGAVIEHWNGRRWAVVDSSPLDDLPCLSDVSVVSRDDIWLVGTQLTTGQTVTEHWDGTSWSLESSRPGELRSVDAASSTDVWAVGVKSRDRVPRALIEHWNGSRWMEAEAPREPGYDTLAGVSAASGSEAMAVGETEIIGRQRTASVTLHWDGGAWEHCGKTCGR